MLILIAVKFVTLVITALSIVNNANDDPELGVVTLSMFKSFICTYIYLTIITYLLNALNQD